LNLFNWLGDIPITESEKTGNMTKAKNNKKNSGYLHYHGVDTQGDIGERKIAEKALEERQTFLDSLINAIPIPVFYKDREGRYTGFNKAFETFFGASRERLIGKTVFDINPPELAAIYHARDNELFESHGVQQYQSQVQDMHGLLHDVQFNKSVYTDGQGNTIGLIGTILDITERKRMEKALQASEARLKALSDASFEAIFLSEKGICLDQNQTAARMFGYTRREAVGRYGTEWFIPEDRAMVLKNMNSGREDPYEATALRKDGTTFPCEIQARMIDYRGRSIRVASLRDITRYRQAKAAQRKSEERFRKVFENAAMGIAITDWDGRFEQCNPAFCALVGYTEEELRRMKFDVLIHPDDREASLSQIQRLKCKELLFFEINNRYVHKDGHPVWAQQFVSVLSNVPEQPAYLVNLVRDITESERAKAQVAALNKKLVERTNLAEQNAVYIQQLAMELSKAEDRERQRIAGLLHGDLQQMLACLKLKITTMEKGQERDDHFGDIKDLIDECIQRCRDLSHELKPFVSQQKDFLGALNWISRQTKEHYGLEVSLQVDGDPKIQSPVLFSLLVRSIRELLFNVVKHSGGTHAWVDVKVVEKQMLITIKDTGKGCDPVELGEKKDKNATFGLLEIQDRVNFLGGYMSVETRSGKGFSVTLCVPIDVSCPSDGNQPIETHGAVPESIEGPPVVASVAPKTRCSISVLIADDHDLMRVGLSKLLQEQDGIDVIGMVADGLEAVQSAARLKPDVILMDVSMPVMNGIDATARISQSFPGTRIIGLTMHKDPDIVQGMLNAGACECLSKEDAPERLIEAVKTGYRATKDS
jgi:PAS domain S-box-containing protein